MTRVDQDGGVLGAIAPFMQLPRPLVDLQLRALDLAIYLEATFDVVLSDDDIDRLAGATPAQVSSLVHERMLLS